MLFGFCQAHPRPQMAIGSSEYPEIVGSNPLQIDEETEACAVNGLV